MLGFPSERDFGNTVCLNLIRNCPITPTDIANAKKIFGPNVPSIKGKPVRRKPILMVSDYVDVPPQILDLTRKVEVASDVMFVNGIPFLVSVSRRLQFITTQYLK